MIEILSDTSIPTPTPLPTSSIALAVVNTLSTPRASGVGVAPINLAIAWLLFAMAAHQRFQVPLLQQPVSLFRQLLRLLWPRRQQRFRYRSMCNAICTGYTST